MKALHRVTRWRWRSSTCSKSNTSPGEPEQAEDALAVRWLDGNRPPVGQLEPNGHQEGEETKGDAPGHSYGPNQLIAEDQRHDEDSAGERLLSKQEELVRNSNKEEIQELCASLRQLHNDRRRSEEMAAARLKAVEGEKAALEVDIHAERAKTAMQQKTMHFLRQISIEAQSVETQLRNELQTLKNEKSQGTNGHSDTKEEKMRSGLARLVEKGLRKRVAVLEQSHRQQADEIRSLLTPLQVLQRNGGSHFDRILTIGNNQGVTLSALYDGNPDCTRLRADFLSAWRLNGLAIERIFRITVPADVRAKHDKYARSNRTVVQRFHGTSCRSTCNLVLDPKKASPCGLQLCNVCNICLQGFKLGKRSARFGRGVYFSSKPGKANAYAPGTEKKENGKRLRCMFVANVVKGSVFLTKKKGFDGGTYPPPGYKSVQAELTPIGAEKHRPTAQRSFRHSPRTAPKFQPKSRQAKRGQGQHNPYKEADRLPG
ncbi:unnamed protein product [Ectocarpus sp. 8 AP-2014]